MSLYEMLPTHCCVGVDGKVSAFFDFLALLCHAFMRSTSCICHQACACVGVRVVPRVSLMLHAIYLTIYTNSNTASAS